MLSGSAISISTPPARPNTLREMTSLTPAIAAMAPASGRKVPARELKSWAGRGERKRAGFDGACHAMDVAENPAKPAAQVGALVKRKRAPTRPARERLAHQVAEREVHVLDDVEHLRI